jgi:hypothetical protein
VSISDIEQKLLLQKIGQKRSKSLAVNDQLKVKTLAAPFVVTSIA